MTLGEFLKLNSETLTQFSARSGISQPYLSRILSGARFPRPEMISRIMDATAGKVTANDLMPPQRHAPPTEVAA